MPVLTDKISDGGAFVQVAINRSGPLLRTGRGAASEPSPPILRHALIDTGAGQTMIDRGVVEELGLESVGSNDLHAVGTGSTPFQGDVYAISFAIVGRSPAKTALIESLRVTEADLSGLGVSVLLGRDVLSRCLLVYNGSLGQFSIAY